MHYLTTEEIQRVLVDLLVEFDGICKEHGLRYSLGYGTLLGAVRHHGFIPWDNDADVLMPRPDYDRLLAHPEWLGRLPVGSLVTDGVPGYFFPFAKVYDPRYRAQEGRFIGLIEEFLWLDVFPIDAIPNDDKEVRRLLRSQERLMERGRISVQNEDAITHNRFKLAAKKLLLPTYRRLFPFREQYRQMEANARQLDWGSTGRVCNVSWSNSKKMPPACMKPTDFDNLVEVEFEGASLPAIPNWDELLTALYGNYMQLPPVEKRVVHNYKTWRTVEG